MYLQLSFVSTGTSVESIQVTLGDKNSALVSCIIDKSSVDLVRSFFDNHQRSDSCQEPPKQLTIHETTFQVLEDDTKATNDHFVSAVQKGLAHYPPEICDEGVNGTYFLKNQQGNTIAVFKPQDEEGTSPTNPKYDAGDASGDLTKGLQEGEGVLREAAAYMLDHSHFSGVPRTCLVDLDQFRPDAHTPTRGSLQEFVPNDGSSWDIGPAVFPTDEVHKIGILDLRIFNADRHGGNILLTKANDGSYQLTPIDHGFSLTDQLDKAWFDWMSFPQAKMPFSPKSLDYIAALDVEKDANILTQLGIRKECIRTMKISTTLLKKGAARGLTLYQIGTMVTRMIYGQACPLESLFSQALTDTNLQINQLLDDTHENQFLHHLNHLFDQALEAFNL